MKLGGRDITVECGGGNQMADHCRHIKNMVHTKEELKEWKMNVAMLNGKYNSSKDSSKEDLCSTCTETRGCQEGKKKQESLQQC